MDTVQVAVYVFCFVSTACCSCIMSIKTDVDIHGYIISFTY